MSTEPDSSEQAAPRERILLAVAAIPAGRVATYGEVARAAGLPGRARFVGRVLRELPAGSRIPWHRVVAAGGRIALRDAGADGGPREQLARLRAEGVPLRPGSTAPRVDLHAASWAAPA
ncbi:MAG: MGMT family protein [Pseudomonadales bacterium]|nr:MGMT family protein [Pseudomonadales bacterium]